MAVNYFPSVGEFVPSKPEPLPKQQFGKELKKVIPYSEKIF
jgi:hypothetical protein